MGENVANRDADAFNQEAIAKAHAIYTPSMMSIYDLLVHGVSNHLAWRCTTGKLLDLYRANLSANHLESGVGTGYFLDRAGGTQFPTSRPPRHQPKIALRVPSGGWRASSPGFATRICSRRSTSISRHSRRSG
jgi:hypothetical protein